MKRFLIVLTALILGYLAYDTARYYLGWYIDLQPDAPVSAFMSTDAQHLYMDRGAGPEEFTVKGVNLGVGVPGEWATDYAVSKETYLRWFAQMQEMGANTVRVYITLHDASITPSTSTTPRARRRTRNRSGSSTAYG